MNKTILALTGIAAFTCAIISFSSSGCSSDNPDGSDTTKPDVVVAGINSSNAFLPSTNVVLNSQAAADTLSWLTFIAMNWPASNDTCGPDTTNGRSILSGGGPVVWESYISDDQVFVPQGSQPAAWCGQSQPENLKHVPQEALALGRSSNINRFIHLTSKASPVHGIDQASGGPLVDQNGRFARYEIRMNFDEYNYIVSNNLWNKSGQEAYASGKTGFDFPTGPIGSMEFKAAWKVIGAGDDSTRFYCIRAIVYNDSVSDPSPDPYPVTLGLVGLHISHKTATQSKWVWSTFEHVDNLTTSFYNPASNQIPNQPITGPQIELDPNGVPLHVPTQVTRVNPYNDDSSDSTIDALNTYFQNLLAGSVWANYKLIGTQWLYFEHIAPKFLANSVQETYLQGPHPASFGNYHTIIDEEYYEDKRYRPFSDSTSSSCMGCHYVATAAGIRSDFSFIMGNAQ